MAIIKSDSLEYLLKNFYDYYDKQVLHFSENPAQSRARFRTALSKCFDLESTDRYWERDGDKGLNSSWFECFINDPDIEKDVGSVYASTFWQIDHFTKVRKEGESVVAFMDSGNIVD